MKETLKKFLPRQLFIAYYYALAFLAACIYRFPARNLTVIGVTGTNGKTTCVYLIHAILQEAGYKTCAASSIDFAIGSRRERNMHKMTMPGPFVLQKFLRTAVNEGCRFAVLEVTSEGILQNRHLFIPFHTAVLTNMSPEHIERHGSFEAYRREKGKIFHNAPCTVINCDDPQAPYFLQIPARAKYGYELNPESTYGRLSELNQLFVIRNVQQTESGFQFIFEDSLMHLLLPGEFNVRNAAVALVVATIHGVPLARSRQALGRVHGIPGRMELTWEHPRVFVDYAHTPEALRNVYETLRSANTKHETRNTKLICVLGSAGGGRDKWKRPELGKLAATYCDYIILTDEDPYDEDPKRILAAVRAGIPLSSAEKCEEILDRRKAIARALEVAEDRDTVVITGKGCEPYMVTSKGKIPWDDRAIVRELGARERRQTRNRKSAQGRRKSGDLAFFL